MSDGSRLPHNETLFSYLRALAAMYIRMTFHAVEVYELLEPLMKDYRKLRLLSACAFPHHFYGVISYLQPKFKLDMA